MIERHVTFSVNPGMTAEFERFIIEEYRPPAAEMPGFIACVLLRELEHPERYQLVFRWQTADDAAAWRTSDVHQALQPALNGLHEGMEITAYSTIA